MFSGRQRAHIDTVAQRRRQVFSLCQWKREEPSQCCFLAAETMMLGSDLEVISCDSLTGSTAMMELFFLLFFFISGSLIRAKGGHFD